MEAQEELFGGNGTGIKVSTFDYSVENHFKAMDMIYKLCGEAETKAVEEMDIQWYKSSITFLREWKHFKYDTRIIKFASETENSLEKCVLSGISLPPFSSATVPKERTDGDATSPLSSKDFVMHVGGSVWALDWCPRVEERPDNHIKCEFIAISVHPPESYYHKMGVPLSGTGFVQVWCVLNLNGNKEEAPPLKKQRAQYNRPKMDKSVEPKGPRGRPKKKPTEEPSGNEAPKEILELVKRPKGRRREKPVEESPNNEVTKENLAQVKRPRGRPRKNPTNHCLNNLDSGSQYVEALAVEYPQDTPGLLAIEGISPKNQYEVKQKGRVKKPKSYTKKLRACTSNLITTDENGRVRSEARKESNADDVALPQLVAYNEYGGSSTANNQIHENSGPHPALPICGSENVSLDINSSTSIPEDVDLPRVVLCLAHNGKVAWDIKWRPSNVFDSKFQHRMGYLAVLLGNGSLEVWDVPLPCAMRSIYSSSDGKDMDPRFVKIKPVFGCSVIKCGDAQSIPMTLEWSTSYPHDYLLAGCHDGTVALWKFFVNDTSSDTRPLLRFSADTVPIRAIAWAPCGSDQESPNLILTAGHLGLKFWDLCDPFRPLWELHPVPKLIYCLDWVPDPRCVILSFDDGTMRLLSLVKAAYDAAVDGKPSVGPKQLGMHAFNCSSSAIWSVQVSKPTGMVAYCSADGTVCRFQLTTKAVEKDPSRHRAPHFLCGSLSEDGSAIVVGSPLSTTPFTLKKPVNNGGDNLKPKQHLSDSNHAQKTNDKAEENPTSDDQPLAFFYGDNPGVESGSDETLATRKGKTKPKSKSTSRKQEGEARALVCIDDEQDKNRERRESGGVRNDVESIPSKMVAMHRVRWNMNKGSERWLCFGGAAGIVRCQEIIMSAIDIKLARKK